MARVWSSAWDDLLAGDELAYLDDRAGARTAHRAAPGRPPPEAARGARAPGHRPSCTPTRPKRGTAAQRGGNVIVTTGTASGKTLAFNLPVLDALAARAEEPRALPLPDEGARAGPGALARRARACPGVRAAIYDGDTPTERRWQIRKWANLVLTNPDMLHIGVLPRHDLWADVLHNLRYVVVDEAHVYRGVFGSHVANVLRRLRRLARDLRRGAAVPARVGDDRESGRARALAARRRGDRRRRRRGAARRADDRAVEPASCSTPSSGSARARSATRRDCIAELVQRDLRTICFAKSRKAAELDPPHGRRPRRRRRRPSGSLRTAPATRRSSGATSSGASSRASSSASRRRTRSSSASTSACSTARSPSAFPAPSRACASSGARAGRRGHGLAVLVASEDALDQYFMREPRDAARPARRGGDPRPRESARARRARRGGRVRGAGRRRRPRDARRRGARARAARSRAAAHEARLGLGGQGLPRRAHAAALGERRRVHRRSTATTGTVLGIVERERAYSTVHEGAVYLHLGEQWLVRELDLLATPRRSSSRSPATGTRR